jgi:hypothetical protein
MTKFLVLYRASTTAAEQMASGTPEQAQAGMDAWMAWAQKAGDSIVDLGVPLEARSHLEAGSTGASANAASGYSIVEADSAEAAADLLAGHPHLTVPGNTIDVLEFLPIPGMEGA